MKKSTNHKLNYLLPAALVLALATLSAGQSYADSASASATGGTAAVSVAGDGESAGGGIVGGNSTVWSTGSDAGGSSGTEGEVWGSAKTKKNKSWATAGGSGSTWANSYSKPHSKPRLNSNTETSVDVIESSEDFTCGTMRSVGANTRANRQHHKYCAISIDRRSNELYAGCCSARFYASEGER